MSLITLTVSYFILMLVICTLFSVVTWQMVKKSKTRGRLWLVGVYVVVMSLFMTYIPFGYILFLRNWG
jgi:uncharacterized membrane protein (DUF485 family)